MTELCAPVKKLHSTTKVDLQEINLGTHKTIFAEDKVAYVEVDWMSPSLPVGKVIVSYHNLEETPDLEIVLKQMQMAHPGAYCYKIATMAHSTLDSLRMMEFLQHHPNIIGLCMGDLGSITRICAPIFNVPIMYAPLEDEDKTAPGQLLAGELNEIYNFKSLTSQTKIYGLIGDPVDRSIGHLFHNDVFREDKRDAVYVKMRVAPGELSDFFALAKKLPFVGLSVTAPLKEAILPFVDEIDSKAQAIGAVNTLVFRNGKIYGSNTDGEAAIDVLGDVKDKTIVVLGAGGSAKAIVYTAVRRGAKVIVVNRTAERAEELAKLFLCGFSEKVPAYDILVNATTSTMPIDADSIMPDKIVMDIAFYETEFLQHAQEKGCFYQDGFPMYFQQAIAQQSTWFCLPA
jgi:3-dehydroquinate dehydratase/shikimate dehydrogenase